MKAMSKTASITLNTITAGLSLDDGEKSSRHVGRKGGAFMRLSVEIIGPHTYSLAHYGEQNGDLMRDPEMCFVVSKTGEWFAYYFRNDYAGVEVTSAEPTFRREELMGWTDERPSKQRDMAAFAELWMRNLRDQHAGWFAGDDRETA